GNVTPILYGAFTCANAERPNAIVVAAPAPTTNTALRITLPPLLGGLAIELQLLTHRVESRAVIPEDLALLLIREGQLEKAFRCLGISRIPVWVVRRKDQPVGAERVDHRPRGELIGFDRDETLTPEG